MTIEAAANLADAGSDSVQPSTSLDDPANLNFLEPEEANEEAEQEPVSADETDEAPDDGSQEAETPTDEAEEDGADEPEKADADDPDAAVVTLQGGEQIPLKELKLGYMRDRDYRHKTTDLGNKRRGLEELSTRVQKSVDAIADFLVKQMPAAPDASLAISDPSRYVREKAMHDASMHQVSQIIDLANAPKDVTKALTDEQRKERLTAENAKLAEAFPVTKTDEGRKKFFDAAASAAKDLGYSDDEIMGVSDHRMFKLAHYARLGLEAEKAKAIATKKVQNVPPVATPKQQQKSAAKVKASQDAMNRLSRTGSIHDAMRIDFD